VTEVRRFWKITSSWKKSRISTASGFPNASFTRAAPKRYGYFEATARSATSVEQIHARQTVSGKRQRKTDVSFVFRLSFTAAFAGNLRDPRGFAIKFLHRDGNWDLVGNNLKIFFIRDAVKFPDLVHAFKPDPVTNRQEARRIFDFISNTPEATHMITFLFSRGGFPPAIAKCRVRASTPTKCITKRAKACSSNIISSRNWALKT
jgi:catalase